MVFFLTYGAEHAAHMMHGGLSVNLIQLIINKVEYAIANLNKDW